MSKPIILSESIWAKLHYQLSKDYPSSWILIREKMKVKLGFTVRRHRQWVKDYGPAGEYDGHGRYENTIRLDFYDEPKRLMFLLKYSDFLLKQPVDKW